MYIERKSTDFRAPVDVKEHVAIGKVVNLIRPLTHETD